MTDDITPHSHPLSLIRRAEVVAKDCNAKACLVVLVGEDGQTWSDCCGNAGESVLWGIEWAKYSLMKQSEKGE